MDRKAWSILGSILFFCVAPALVAGWVPYRLTHWRLGPPPLGIPALRWAGAVLTVLGAAGLVDCFARFAIQGLGTPAPIAPPQKLVVTGLYRFVRNPMYVSVVTATLGQALLSGSVTLLWYSAVMWVIVHVFVLAYEEPVLQRRFGASYDAYRRGVRRWWPRLFPWNGVSADIRPRGRSTSGPRA